MIMIIQIMVKMVTCDNIGGQYEIKTTLIKKKKICFPKQKVENFLLVAVVWHTNSAFLKYACVCYV